MESSPLVAVVGPTATGKSDLAGALAAELGGEIVNADALQLYRGMDIGTAKLRPEQREGIAHHQLDVLEVTQEASVSAYQQAAREDIAAIRGRGRVPVLVGGSGLYLRAVLDDIELPPTDPVVRAPSAQRAHETAPGLLHPELSRSDPEAAATIDAHDTRRIVRALEVGELTGRPFTAFLPRPRYVDPCTIQLGLRLPRPVLHERIERRVTGMVGQGLLEEGRQRREHGLDHGRRGSPRLGD